jgi:hypothetical protein
MRKKLFKCGTDDRYTGRRPGLRLTFWTGGTPLSPPDLDATMDFLDR